MLNTNEPDNPQKLSATGSPSSRSSSNVLEGPMRESWYLRVNDLVNQRALLLEFAVLLSANGFRRVAQVRAVTFHRLSASEVSKAAVQQLFDLSSFRRNDRQISIEKCVWSENASHGSVRNANQSVEWDLSFHPGPETIDVRAPAKSGWIGRIGQLLGGAIAQRSWSSGSSQVDLRVSGTVKVNGESFTLTEAPGSTGRSSGAHLPQSWIWAQGSAFLNERGTRVTFAFEGLSVRERLLGRIAGPASTSLFFLYQDKPYFFSSVRNPLTVRSQATLSRWVFSAEAGDLVFRGEARAEFRDFAGVTIEDTNGSFVHAATSLVSDLEVRVYRRGKIESAFYANGIGTLEVSQRSRNPYVPSLI